MDGIAKAKERGTPVRPKTSTYCREGQRDPQAQKGREHGARDYAPHQAQQVERLPSPNALNHYRRPLMAYPRKILILGASYGSLLATKLLLAGQTVSLVCFSHEADLINSEGILVRIPLKRRAGVTEIASRRLPGKLDATTPDAADPSRYDLVCLAMQEPQYRSAEVRELMSRIAALGKPVMSIMNMPPLPFLARIPALDLNALESCYADARVWDGFTPAAFHDGQFRSSDVSGARWAAQYP